MTSTVRSFPAHRVATHATRCVFYLVLAVSVLLSTAQSAVAQAQGNAERQLVDITAGYAPTGQRTLTLTFNEGRPPINIQPSRDPAALIVMLGKTGVNVDDLYQSFDSGPIQSVSVAPSDQNAQVNIDLTEYTGHRYKTLPTSIVITLGEAPEGLPKQAIDEPKAPRADSGSAGPTGPDQSVAGTALEQTMPRGQAVVEHITYRRSQDGAGRLEIRLPDPTQVVKVDESGSEIQVRLPGSVFGPEVPANVDVQAFDTAARAISTVDTSDGARVLVAPMPGETLTARTYRAGSQYYVEITPADAQASQRQANSRAGDRNVSLSFQNISLKSVLQLIADIGDINIVVTDTVQGEIALRLKDVAWRQALEIILDAKQLGMEEEGDVITVAPIDQILSMQKKQLQAERSQLQLAPLETEIVTINYPSADEVAEVIRSVNPVGNGANAQGEPEAITAGQADRKALLSPRGSIAVDSRKNLLLITDTKDHLRRIKEVIEVLDTPVRQVLIRSQVVSATRQFSREIGLTQSGSADTGAAGANDGQFGYNVSLPTPTTPSGVFSTSIIEDTIGLNLQLQALENTDKGRIISSPRVVTTNGQEALVQQGREIPYQEGGTGALQAATVQFKQVVLGLTVTPRITPNERVSMLLDITQDTVGENVSTVSGGAVPSINTRRLTTRVLVDNGNTIILGGVREDDNRLTEGRIPILGDLPLIGGLFRNSQRSRQNRELLIFITPYVLDKNRDLDQAAGSDMSTAFKPVFDHPAIGSDEDYELSEIQGSTQLPTIPDSAD